MGKQRIPIPANLEEIDAALREQRMARWKLELELSLGKLRNTADLVKSRRRTARLLTKRREVGSRGQGV